MAVAASAFVAEVAAGHTLALAHQRDPILVINLFAIDRFATAVPNAEDDATLGGAVYLHAEVAAMPATCHVVGMERIFQPRHLAIESRDVRVLWKGVSQVNRGGIAARLEIEMRVRCRQAAENQRVEIAKRLAGRIERLECKALIAFFDREGAEAGVDKVGARPFNLGFVGLAANAQAKF